ncbi:Sec1 family protein [Necator americanus]|uniref:Sec1 family protein n=1 Tax=Necator americanus TaxID=51031 RepID=W2T0H5_NECAM|nr:Sec1 family protein [Necator americanus]ETN75505.1 Sec1 family protein [Necator americanus]
MFLRYQRSSEDCKRLADDLNQVMRREEGLFDNAKRDTVLLIIDRSEDPVTPLLNQWTYEAMVHELITINNNRVAVDNQSMVLSELHDEFYAKNVSSNFGEIGQNIKLLMNEFQQKSQIHKNLESIADMKNFVEEYPQFKKISGTVSKHVTLMGELSKIVANQNLLEISEHTDAANVVRALLRYAGSARRKSDLFGEGSTMEMTKRFIKGLKGVENIYTQHEPYIKTIMENVTRGKLSEQQYPYVAGDVTK